MDTIWKYYDKKIKIAGINSIWNYKPSCEFCLQKMSDF